MKTLLILVSLIAAALVAGTIIHFNRKNARPAPAAQSEAAPGKSFTHVARLEVPLEELAESALHGANQPAGVVAAIDNSSEAAAGTDTVGPPPPTGLSRTIDTLVSPLASFQQKQAAWRQLQAARQLDQVIDALKQGATENPASAAYPAALGQAQLYKAGAVAQDGGALNELGILGMQADQNFDAALKLDPANWEAQFFKAAAMHHWPLELNMGDQVIQRLSSLIDQQETMLPQPQFGQTYVVLGDQYQKMGQPEHAAATWLMGARKFPGHLELQQKVRAK
jgi:tetratricopeptide (TPR) repeat protein